MLTFIHSSFKLDITDYNVTLTEINQWFKDDFSTESSLPFSIYLDAEMEKQTDFSTHYNSNLSQKIFEGVLDKDGVLVSGILKFQSIKGKKISAVLILGQDKFPNFDKKLSELPLEQKAISSITDEAITVIKKGYPETNYNFGMVHTDKYDAESNDWHGFEGTINKHVNGAFVQNALDLDTNIDSIKNIIQPMPYLMHVLKVGVESAGYTLEGDIVEDASLKKALIFRDGNYYNRTSEEEIPIVYQNNQYDYLSFVNNTFQYVEFLKEITIEKKGDYILFGSFFSLTYSSVILFRRRCSSVNIKLEKVSAGVSSLLGQIDLPKVAGSGGLKDLQSEVFDFTCDIEVSFNAGDKLRITKIEPKRDYVPSKTPDYPEAISLKLIPIRFRNPDGSPIISVLPLNEINLSRVVPDMTFRDLIKIIKNYKNYSFDANGKVIRMDRIETKLNRIDAVDLSEFEIDEPELTLNEDRVFELMFTDGKAHEIYKYDSLLISKSGAILNDYSVKDTVKQIKIDAMPLPLIIRNGISSAFSFEEANSKLRLVFMNPVVEAGSPVTYWEKNMTIPFVYNSDYLNWLKFRINSIEWNWDFVIPVEKFREIKVQTLVYAYKNYHIFTEIEKERLNILWQRITAKTESLL